MSTVNRHLAKLWQHYPAEKHLKHQQHPKNKQHPKKQQWLLSLDSTKTRSFLSPHRSQHDDFNLAVVLPQRVFVAVIGRPDELQSGTEAFIPQRHGRVDAIFTIATNDDKPPVGIVTNALRVQIRGTQVFEIQRNHLAVFHFRLARNGFDVSLI